MYKLFIYNWVLPLDYSAVFAQLHSTNNFVFVIRPQSKTFPVKSLLLSVARKMELELSSRDLIWLLFPLWRLLWTTL